RGLAHHAEEHLLRDLVGGQGGAQLAEHEIVDRELMPPQKRDERAAIAALVAQHQRLVAHFLSFSPRRHRTVSLPCATAFFDALRQRQSPRRSHWLGST